MPGYLRRVDAVQLTRTAYSGMTVKDRKYQLSSPANSMRLAIGVEMFCIWPFRHGQKRATSPWAKASGKKRFKPTRHGVPLL